MFKKQYKEFSFSWNLFLQITPFFETHPFSTWLKGNGEQYHTVYSYVFYVNTHNELWQEIDFWESDIDWELWKLKYLCLLTKYETIKI